MSGIANPRKNFRFVLELDGANAFLIQEVQAPTMELSVVKHGAPMNLPDGKTPGKMVIGDMVVKKLCPAQTADTWVEDWMANAIAGIKKDFIKTGFLKHVAPDGARTIQKWFLGDVWPSKLEPGNLVYMGPGENYIQTVTFQVQFYVPQESPLFVGLVAGGGAILGGIAVAGAING